MKKKTSPKYKALNHFDEFYGSVFGDQWQPMREAMLRRSKYVAVVNNYGDTDETIELLTNRGEYCIYLHRALYFFMDPEKGVLF